MVTASAIWVNMSGWSWITFWATPDPVGKIKKQRWSSVQNSVGISLISDHSPKKQTEILRLFSPVFLSSPGPCEAPHACVQSFHPEHAHPCLEASLPEKVETRNTQSRLESGMRHGFPYTNGPSFASRWEFSVFVRLAAHMHNTSVLVWLLQTGSGVCHIHTSCGLCTDEKKRSGSPQNFTFSISLSLAIKLGWSWKGEWGAEKAGSNKGLSWGNWGTN